MPETGTPGCVSSEGWRVQQEVSLPGQSQEPRSSDSRVAGNQDPEAYRQISLGEITSYRAVTTVNVDVASKMNGSEGRARNPRARQHGVPKSDRCGTFASAGWKRQHGGKDTPSNWRSPPRPGEKSPEQDAV